MITIRLILNQKYGEKSWRQVGYGLHRGYNQPAAIFSDGSTLFYFQGIKYDYNS